jgi:transcriptional regulator with XRE-family HTH domain
MNGRSRSPHPLPVPASLLIHHARRRGGRSPREVADRAGIRESAVVHYELGKRVPSWDHLQRIVLACGFWLDVRLRELGPFRLPGRARDEPVDWGPDPGPAPTGPGVDLDAAVYLGHRLRVVREELAAMASCLEAVAESFKHAEARHYERFSRLVVALPVPALDQALTSLERELRVVRSSRRRLPGGRRRLRGSRVDASACARLAEHVANARGRLAPTGRRLRAERLDDMARAVELQGRELGEIERAFRSCQEDVDAVG